MKRFWNSIAIVLLLVLAACSGGNPTYTITTELGEIELELYADKAPATVANFVQLVEDEAFADGQFYRVVHMDNQPYNDVKIEVIQGGLFEDSLIQNYPTIEHETTEVSGILHTDGVVSMARLEPGTASTEFFICVGDQPSLDFGGKRNPDGQGFAAFGKVISGMEVVRKIQKQKEHNQMLEKRIAFSIK